MKRGPVSRFIEHHYRHFNAAALRDAAEALPRSPRRRRAMMITLGGAMSTAARAVARRDDPLRRRARHHLTRRQPGGGSLQPGRSRPLRPDPPLTAT